MSSGSSNPARECERLSQSYPNWCIRISGKSRWWKATRLNRTLTEKELSAGLAQTLIEDSGELLQQSLIEQARIESGLR